MHKTKIKKCQAKDEILLNFDAEQKVYVQQSCERWDRVRAGGWCVEWVLFLEDDDGWIGWLVGWLKEKAKAYVQVLTEAMFYIF